MRWAVESGAMRRIDQCAIEERGIPGLTLMENAGRAVADAAVTMVTRNELTIVLCGTGNNGGDGLVAARHLRRRGYPVAVWLAGPSTRLTGDSAANLQKTHEVDITLEEVTDDPLPAGRRSALGEAGLIIDALLGTGSTGAPRGTVGALVHALQLIRKPILAVDIPTGLNSDTGQVEGPVVRATSTVTMGLLKAGMLFHPGCVVVGNLVIADIGFPDDLVTRPQGGIDLLERGDLSTSLSKIPSTAHKGECGRILVIAGSTGMTGAAALCCQSSLRVGAGLVYLAIPDHLDGIMEIMLPEVITLPSPQIDGQHSARAVEVLRERMDAIDVVVLGPGLGRGPGPAELVDAVLSAWRGPLVLDADALFHLPGHTTFSERVVLTPHLGEMARLTGIGVEALQKDRLGAARSEASRRHATVLMKDAPSVIAEPAGRTGVNLSGNAGLATGGSGDVLAGVLAGFMAQGADAYSAALAGAFVHGLTADLAADEMPHASIIPTDLIRLLPKALAVAGYGDRSEPVPWWKRERALSA